MNRYVHMQEYGTDIHIVTLSDFSRLHVTKKGFKPVSAVGQELEHTGAKLVINGDGWGLGATSRYYPNSIAVSDGNVAQSKQLDYRPWLKWQVKDGLKFGWNWRWRQLTGKYNVISGDRFIMQDAAFNEAIDVRNYKDARTVIGVTADWWPVFMVADGNDRAGIGLSFLECYRILEDFNVVTAINLDGGGSSAMWLEDGIVNKPNHDGDPGERATVNHVVAWYEGTLTGTTPPPEPPPPVAEWPEKIIAVSGAEERVYVPES